MRFNVITLFPEVFIALVDFSILARASKKKIIEISLCNLRDFGLGKRKQVDDTPYGGGAGMVLRVDVLTEAIRKTKQENPNTWVILVSPKGEKFDQDLARSLSKKENITLICGHYEGFDERVRNLVNQEISLGDFVLSGGEIAAAAIIDATARLTEGVVGNISSVAKESFDDGLLEYPQYTKPAEFGGEKVPNVLLSGNHQEIEKWRNQKAEELTKNRRPDLTGKKQKL